MIAIIGGKNSNNQRFWVAIAIALNNAQIIEKFQEVELQFSYEYLQMNEVMSAVKEFDLKIIQQDFNNDCKMTCAVRKGLIDNVFGRFERSTVKVEQMN